MAGLAHAEPTAALLPGVFGGDGARVALFNGYRGVLIDYAFQRVVRTKTGVTTDASQIVLRSSVWCHKAFNTCFKVPKGRMVRGHPSSLASVQCSAGLPGTPSRSSRRTPRARRRRRCPRPGRASRATGSAERPERESSGLGFYRILATRKVPPKTAPGTCLSRFAAQLMFKRSQNGGKHRRMSCVHQSCLSDVVAMTIVFASSANARRVWKSISEHF